MRLAFCRHLAKAKLMTVALKERKIGAVADRFRCEERLHLPDGRVLSYMQFGAPEGLPVFGFHGTPGSRFMFRLADEPARRMGVRIIAPERPGFGVSTFQRNRTLSDWACDVMALANELGLSRFGVAGVSGGGPYAAACAALLPDRVTAAALVSPVGPVQPPEGARVIGAAQHLTFRLFHRITLAMRGALAVGRLMFLNTPTSIYDFILSRAVQTDRRILSRHDVRRNLIDGVAEGLRPGVRGAIQEMKIFGRPWNIPFSAIRAPTFLWQGTADRNVPVAAALHLAELIPNCRLWKMDGAGHYWIFDHIEDVLQVLKKAMLGYGSNLSRKSELKSIYVSH